MELRHRRALGLLTVTQVHRVTQRGCQSDGSPQACLARQPQWPGSRTTADRDPTAVMSNGRQVTFDALESGRRRPRLPAKRPSPRRCLCVRMHGVGVYADVCESSNLGRRR